MPLLWHYTTFLVYLKFYCSVNSSALRLLNFIAIFYFKVGAVLIFPSILHHISTFLWHPSKHAISLIYYIHSITSNVL